MGARDKEGVLGIHSEGMKLPNPTKKMMDAPTNMGLVNKNFDCPLNLAPSPCLLPLPLVYGMRRLIGIRDIPPRTKNPSPRLTIVALYPNLPNMPLTSGGKIAPPRPVPANITPEARPRRT